MEIFNGRTSRTCLVKTLLMVTIYLSSLTANAGLIFINEIHYDNTGSDVNEAVELAASLDLSTEFMFLRFYNGDNNQVYKTQSLKNKQFTNFNNGMGFLSLAISSIQNGPADGIALFDGNRLIQFLSYEGSLTITDDLLNNVTSHNIGIQESSSTPTTGSMQLVGEGHNYDDFVWQHVNNSNFGSINQGQHFSRVPEPKISTLLLLPLICCFRRFKHAIHTISRL